MKNTPRKRTFTARPREQTRFLQYLFARSCFVALSVACIGWLAAAGSTLSSDHDVTNQMSIEKWGNRLGRFEENIETDGSFSSSSLAIYYHVQDVMSCQLLLGMIAQLITMLERGQEMRDIYEMMQESFFPLNSLAIVIVHVVVLIVRAGLRDNGFALYRYMRYDIWIAMVIFPLCGLLVGNVVNSLDDKSYRRYMQFLRLEFDTRLGMHSPK